MPKKIQNQQEPKISVMLDLANYITADENGKPVLPTEIQVLPLGTWDTVQYGPIEITKQFCAAIVDNFKKKLRKGLPIDINHDREAAAGWMEDLYVKESGENPGLYAKSDWTPLGDEKLGGKIYRFFSPEWSDDYVDPLTGMHHGPVLIAGTLTNRPLFKQLTPLVAHESNLTNDGGAVVLLHQSNINFPTNNHMTPELQKALEKKANELTAEEKALIKAGAADLNDEQRKTFEEVINEKTAEQLEADKAEAEAKAKADADKAEADKKQAEADAAQAAADAEAAKTADEKLVTMTAGEKTNLVKLAEEGKKALEVLENKKAEETAQGFLMSESNKAGKILPKAKDTLTQLIRSFSPTQMKFFSEVVANIPETKYFAEIGKDAIAVEGAAAKTAFEVKVQDVITASEKSGTKLTLKQAQLEVAAKHPELYKAYEDGLQSTRKAIN